MPGEESPHDTDRYRGQEFTYESLLGARMTAGDRLAVMRNEHRGIVRQVGLVARSLRASRPNMGRLHDSISELSSRLETHFAHEEGTIYRPLDSRLERNSPTAELVRDHRAIRGEMKMLAMTCAEGSSAGELKDRFSALRSVLDRHLGKEEKVVFWLVEHL